MKTKLGLGGYITNPIDNPESIIKYAYEFENIRFFDTSPVYGDSEIHIGNALKDFNRNSYTISTKTKSLDIVGFHNDFLNSIKNLNTDYIDIYFGHSFIDDDETFEKSNFVLHEMARLKRAGRIKHVGVSGHSVSAAIKAIRSGNVDFIMIPHSIMYRKFEGVMDFANSMGVSVITMKNFSSGILLGGNQENEFNQNITLQDIMNFQCFNGGDFIIPAVRSIEQLKSISKAYRESIDLSSDNIKYLEKKIISYLGVDFCRFCNECRPCKKFGWQMSQPGILKSLIYQTVFNIDMLDTYKKYKLNVTNCDDCDSECSLNCPFGIDIKEQMQTAKRIFEEGN